MSIWQTALRAGWLHQLYPQTEGFHEVISVASISTWQFDLRASSVDPCLSQKLNVYHDSRSTQNGHLEIIYWGYSRGSNIIQDAHTINLIRYSIYYEDEVGYHPSSNSDRWCSGIPAGWKTTFYHLFQPKADAKVLPASVSCERAREDSWYWSCMRTLYAIPQASILSMVSLRC
jgi:hypothetical protein